MQSLYTRYYIPYLVMSGVKPHAACNFVHPCVCLCVYVCMRGVARYYVYSY